jgi:hypothetical protein
MYIPETLADHPSISTARIVPFPPDLLLEMSEEQHGTYY